MPSTSPCGWLQVMTSGPVGGMRAISSRGVSSEMPMTSSACAQNGWPLGTPIASNWRIRRSRWNLAVASSIAWITFCCTGCGKVVA
jgi:hypothetical protein